MTHQHDRAGGVFRDLFGRQPQIAAAAPGRVNLIGEHVDYCGGFVLPMAIERETVIVAARRTVVAGEPVARVHSTACHETVEIPLGTRASRPRGGGGWSQYVAGVVAGFVDRGVVIPPFDAVIDSTVPLGGGLSSSASLEVAVATLVIALAGHAIEPVEVALLCQQAEHEFAGVPCGVMDQCASALCVRDHLLLLDCRSLDIVQVPFNRPDLLVLVTNSNIRHALNNGEYAQRRSDCQRAAAILGVASLREATLGQVEAFRDELGDTGFRRARHVVTEIARTQAAAVALFEGDWDALGGLMAESHESLRSDYEVSCAELDLLVILNKSAGVGPDRHADDRRRVWWLHGDAPRGRGGGDGDDGGCAGLSAGGRPRLHDVHDAAGGRSAGACMGGCQQARSLNDCVGTMFDAAPCVASDPPADAEGLYGT